MAQAIDKRARIAYNSSVAFTAQICGHGGIGIRARLRGVSARVRVQVPLTAPERVFLQHLKSCKNTRFFCLHLAMAEGDAVDGCALRFSKEPEMLRKTGAAVGFIFNPQNRLCGSRLEALWASKSASPTATAKSEILTPRRWSGPGGRFLYHFSSRPGPRFTCPGFRPCGAHVPLAPLRVASTLGKSMICHR